MECVLDPSACLFGKGCLAHAGIDGVEVLRRVKGSPSLRNMPVIMLTTTDDPREVEECYRLGCNCYVTKPIEFTSFSEALRTLGLFVTIVQVAPLSAAH